MTCQSSNRVALISGWLTLVLVASWNPVARADLVVLTGPEMSTVPTVPLARVLSLTTNEYSMVSMTADDGEESWSKTFHTYGTEHELPVLGFKADRTYHTEITIQSLQGETLVVPGPNITTDSLPAVFPSLELLESRPSLMEPGYTLFSLVKLGGGGIAYIVIVDSKGEVVWYLPQAVGDLRRLPNGNLFFVNRNGAAIEELNMLGEAQRVWHATETDETPAPGSILVDSTRFHHEVFPTGHGTILTLLHEDVTVENYPTSETDPGAPTATAEVIDDPVLEISSDTGEITGKWSLLGMLDPTRIGYDSVFPCNPDCRNDWGHANAVIHDRRDDSIIVSVRHQDAVIKFSRTTGDLIWILGPHENWGPEFQPFLLTPVGAVFEWEYHPHAPMVTPEGTLLLFDNGNHRASPFEPGMAALDSYSRAVEYSIDEENMEVSQVWEYGAITPERLYAGFVSDADWLESTGNVLITFGGLSVVDGVATNGISPRIVEVDRNDAPDKLFELSLFDPTPGARGWLVYRSERIPDLYAPHPALSLDVSPHTSVQLGTGDVTVSAATTGTAGSYEHQFWLEDPAGTWDAVQDYGLGDTFTWTPTAPGQYVVTVRARSAGSAAALETFNSVSIAITEGVPVASVTLTSDTDSPVLVTTAAPITFTAAASGGAGIYDYQFWVQDPSGAWSMEQDYGNGNVFVEVLPTAGLWYVQARARNLGGAAEYEAHGGLPFEIEDPPVASVSLGVDKTSPGTVLTVGSVTFTGAATGGSGDYHYEFWVRGPDGIWKLEQEYGSDSSYTLVPNSVGTWYVQVRARNVASDAPYEALAGAPFVIVEDPPVATVNISADASSPASIATVGTVTFTATSTGGTGSYDYEFWVLDPSETWSLGQAYGNGDSFAWTPPGVGIWVIAARARNLGSAVDFDVFEVMGFEITP